MWNYHKRFWYIESNVLFLYTKHSTSNVIRYIYYDYEFKMSYDINDYFHPLI